MSIQDIKSRMDGVTIIFKDAEVRGAIIMVDYESLGDEVRVHDTLDYHIPLYINVVIFKMGIGRLIYRRHGLQYNNWDPVLQTESGRIMFWWKVRQ